ncbi:gluconate 2-dehydrogenase subunit 3 family protein [Pigmentiphaga soli]|uniref:Gluconate 2-dehydrogenase subunit 3 family protein n=1 Tax=Pigmentiphaga soli TaxID=1007095 RepID=A0ABP8HDN5_9BURK
MHQEDEPRAAPARRRFLRLGLISVAAVPAASCSRREPASEAANASPQQARPQEPYRPTFFTQQEWDFLTAACDRLIPSDDAGPGAVEAGVPEFLDRHMQTPYARGEIWYMQGPFVEAGPEFGYQGRLALRDMLRAGIKGIDAHCVGTYQGKHFAELDHGRQEEVLKAAEAGKLQIDEVPAKQFFSSLLTEVRNGYFADPSHGGNKNMAGWKAIGYPGMRADYLDWVEVRDKPYPIAPVDLSGRRA